LLISNLEPTSPRSFLSTRSPRKEQQKRPYVVAVIDTEWAASELRRFIQMTELHRAPPRPGITDFGERLVAREPNSVIVPAAQVVEQILDRVLPDWRSQPAASKTHRWIQHREASLRALAQLERQEELKQRLGEDTPQLDASHLHPWVWDGARSLWQSGHYGEAVLAASRKVNAEAQNKLGRRDIGETELLQAAFSPNPAKPGDARLRLSTDDGSKTFKSLHAGAGSFAHGCYGALRNPGSHQVENEIPEDEALERLAAFSILARWIDAAEVVR